jgi:hypothetical protein
MAAWPMSAYGGPMPMLQRCAFPGCGALSFGELCIEHERVPTSSRETAETSGPRRSQVVVPGAAAASVRPAR